MGVEKLRRIQASGVVTKLTVLTQTTETIALLIKRDDDAVPPTNFITGKHILDTLTAIYSTFTVAAKKDPKENPVLWDNNERWYVYIYIYM